EAVASEMDMTLAPAAQIYPFTSPQCWRGEIFDLETWEQVTREASVAHYWVGSYHRRPMPIDGLPWNFPASPSTAPVKPLKFPAPAAEMKISCIVTGGADEDVWLAVDSFRRQTHPNKELIIARRGADLPPEAWRRADVKVVTAP